MVEKQTFEETAGEADFWSINLLVRKQTPLDKGGPHQVRCDGSNFSLTFYLIFFLLSFLLSSKFFFFFLFLAVICFPAKVWRIHLFSKFLSYLFWRGCFCFPAFFIFRQFFILSLFLLLLFSFFVTVCCFPAKVRLIQFFRKFLFSFFFWTVSSKGAMDSTFWKCFDWFLCSQRDSGPGRAFWGIQLLKWCFFY